MDTDFGQADAQVVFMQQIGNFNKENSREYLNIQEVKINIFKQDAHVHEQSRICRIRNAFTSLIEFSLNIHELQALETCTYALYLSATMILYDAKEQKPSWILTHIGVIIIRNLLMRITGIMIFNSNRSYKHYKLAHALISAIMNFYLCHVIAL